MATSAPTPGQWSFTVEPCDMAIISAVGLRPADKLVLLRMACPEKTCPGDGTESWIDFSPEGCLHAITTANNPLVVKLPGRYRVEFDGQINPDVEVCAKTYKQCCC